MQNFKDTATGKYWAFDDDVVVEATPDGPVFYTAMGEKLTAPLTLVSVEEIPIQLPDVIGPQVVSRFQGREAMWQTPLGDTTVFEAADALINHPDTPPMYQRAWADMQEFRRDSEMLAAIATQLGLTQQQIDDLFILAASINA